MTFESRAESMGLTNNNDGTFSYSDNHGAVTYKKLNTPHEEIPYLAVFTGPNLNEMSFTNGIISSIYRFKGNEVINQSIRENIRSSNQNILRENILISKDYCQMYNATLIDNSTQYEQGIIYPTFIILNSYNGTRREQITFGLTISGENTYTIGFSNTLGAISQIHAATHSTLLSSVVGDFAQIIHDNIGNVITQNLNNVLDEQAILSSLDLVEKLGKRKRNLVSSYLSELSEDNITSWDLFLAILRYSTVETNLNVKIAMENLAEKVLILPQRMINAAREIR